MGPDVVSPRTAIRSARAGFRKAPVAAPRARAARPSDDSGMLVVMVDIELGGDVQGERLFSFLDHWTRVGRFVVFLSLNLALHVSSVLVFSGGKSS